MTVRVLVGDIGGTHARFAVVDCATTPWKIDSERDIEAVVPDFASALRRYLDESGSARPPEAIALAVAGPVTAGAVSLTNRRWHISEAELRALGFKHALLINDFAALAYAVTALAPGDCHVLGPDLPGIDGEPISIIGAGTGFGASLLAQFRGRALAVATEGGHAGFAPGNAREIEILRVLARQFEHVSIERILSGPGLENLHRAIAELNGRSAGPHDAANIVANAATDADCREAISVFCGVYGAVAGDFALAHGARGGVFLAGGIAQKIEKTLAQSSFRSRFESKGRLSGYVKSIPTRLILNEKCAFLGAARASLEFQSGDGRKTNDRE
ncbi:MAG TPA: glucokinase [Rhizomicrobium sp.]|nr:glucokinase [Rhizomicrobium sp.]